MEKMIASIVWLSCLMMLGRCDKSSQMSKLIGEWRSLSIQHDTARFEMTIDRDQDGSNDDYYLGIQKKYSD